MQQYEQLVKDVAAAYMLGDRNAIRELNWNYGTAFACDRNPVDVQRRLTAWFRSEARTLPLAIADARQIVAHSYGFENWLKFTESFSRPPGDPRSAPLLISSTPPFYKIDWKENRLSIRGPNSEKDWDTIAAVMKEHRIAKLSAGGMTDAGMERVSWLAHVTHLHIGDSKGLTDEGAKHLARMPQLLDLELGGWTSSITDRALEALEHLT